jgi:hypothetical protein
MGCCVCAGSCNHVGPHGYCAAHGGGAPLPLAAPGTWQGFTIHSGSTTGIDSWLCPDLLTIDRIGAADGWRGRLVRAFFRVLKVVTGV